MIAVSTGYKAKLFRGTSFPELFNGGIIELFDGARPSPDLAPTGTKIARISFAGGAWTPGSALNGLTYLVADSGAVLKPATDSWILTGINAGTITWGRMFGVDDTAALSYEDARIDFDVNPVLDMSGMHMTNPSPGVGEQFPVTYFLFGIPPL